MSQINDYEEKSVEYWKKMANRLAIALAIAIFAGGTIFSWLSFELKTLDAFRKHNKMLSDALTEIRETLAVQTKELSDHKVLVEDLEGTVVDLKRKESIQKFMDMEDELERTEKRVELLSDTVADLKSKDSVQKSIDLEQDLKRNEDKVLVLSKENIKLSKEYKTLILENAELKALMEK